MKRLFFHALGAATHLAAALAACVGCTKGNSEPTKPREFHWRGPETGYENTTVVPPGDNAGPAQE